MKKIWTGLFLALLSALLVLTACSIQINDGTIEGVDKLPVSVEVTGLEGVTGEARVEVIEGEAKAEALTAVKDVYYVADGTEVYAVDIAILDGEQEVEVGKPVTVTITLPEAKLPLDRYVVFHIHDGKAEQIIPTVTDGKLTFTVDSFSPFIVVPAHEHEFGEWTFPEGEFTCGDSVIQTSKCACGAEQTRDYTFDHFDDDNDGKCDRCGQSMSGETHTHEFGEWTTVKAATCTEEGMQERKCACGVAETQPIEALGHADENKDGKCDRCGQSMGGETHTHEFGRWTTVKAATCTEAGMEERKCACGVAETQAIEALGHADENKDGKCDRCGQSMGGETHTHEFGRWTTVQEATCTEAGKQERKCACGVAETQAIEALGHADENKDGKCDRCGQSMGGETHTHEFGRWTTVQEATCTEAGKQERKCACGVAETQAIEALGHADRDGDGKCDRCGLELGSGSDIPCTVEAMGATGSILSATVTELSQTDKAAAEQLVRDTFQLAEGTTFYSVDITVKDATSGMLVRLCIHLSNPALSLDQYAVYHIHNGTAEMLETQVSGSDLIVMVDSFSPFIIGPKHLHSASTLIVETAATCTADGKGYVECIKCHKQLETKVIPALGHVDDNGDGKCDRCGAEMGSSTHTHSFGEWTTAKAATCTEPGLEQRKCSCGETESKKIEALGHIDENKDGKCDRCGKPMSAEHTHEYGSWITVKTATCTEAGSEKRVCTCGAEETRTVNALGHTDVDKDGKCDRCGITIGGGAETGDDDDPSSGYTTIEFGSYPQTKVIDETLLSALNGLAGEFPTQNAFESNGWTSYGYYRGSNQDNSASNVFNFMYYKDVTYQGNKYRGVYMVGYRPNITIRLATPDNTFQDDNGYKFGKGDSYLLLWFKFEPIKWRVLETKDGKSLLIADLILDSQAYLNVAEYVGLDDHSNSIHMNTNPGVPEGTYANNYEYSSIRAWLNNDFYNTAFSALQKERIILTRVDNGINSSMPINGNDDLKWNAGTRFLCNNTDDYIFLPSEVDITTASYGFMNPFERYALDKNRVRKYTDYALSQGLHVYGSAYTDDEVYGEYWLRTPLEYDSDHSGYGVACTVDEEGYAANGSFVCWTAFGVVPMLWLQDAE